MRELVDLGLEPVGGGAGELEVRGAVGEVVGYLWFTIYVSIGGLGFLTRLGGRCGLCSWWSMA